MSDQARVRLDPSIMPEQVAEALRRVTGRAIVIDRPRPGDDIALLRVAGSRLVAESFGMAIGADPDRDGEAEVSVYACDPSRETMRALAMELGGRYRGSDDEHDWESPSSPTP